MHGSIRKGTNPLKVLSIAAIIIIVIIVRFRQALHTPPVPTAATANCPTAAMPQHLTPPLLLLLVLLLWRLLLLLHMWRRLLWRLLISRCLLLAALGCGLC
jgi:hypothetical protein